MAIQRRKDRLTWRIVLWDKTLKKHVRISSGTRDRDAALAIEAAMKQARTGKAPADKLHVLIDVWCGTKRPEMPLAGAWVAYANWLKASGRRIGAETLKKRSEIFRRFMRWTGEHWQAAVSVEAVDRACAAAFAESLARDGLKGKSRKNIIGDLGTIWEGLRRVRDGVNNPWPLVLPTAHDSERGQAFTREQEKAVLEAADAAGGGWGLACRIARHTGLRYGDVARLKWAAVDLEAGVIRLEPGKTARHGMMVEIPMCGELRESFNHVEEVDSCSSTCLHGEKFVLPEHAAVYPRTVEMKAGTFARILEAAGIGDGYTFHSWRHTFRTRLAEVGTPDEIARRLGGWTNSGIDRRYDHAARMEEMRAAVEKAGGNHLIP